ncbi:MAG TPA: glycosyltransferase family 2 protein, partial [Pyrinomonadaceae bacterium]
QPVFYGQLETPKESANVAGELEIEGWVFSTDAAVVRVEAFIDDFYLGRLRYGSKREDVLTAYPAQARADCGYSERVKLKTTMAGHRKLIVRAYDELGNAQIYHRLIVVGSPKMALRAVADDGSNGNGARGSVAAVVAEQSPSADGAEANYFGQLKALVDEYKSRTESEPAILNWNTGLNLAAALPQLAVFSPPESNAHPGLPYLDHSVDIVVLPAGDSRRLAEAHRVASAAVVQAHGVGEDQLRQSGGKRGAQARVRLVTEWIENTKGEAALPSTSIIIPVHNKVDYTEQCLKQLLDTLPGSFRGEIIVVDDASTDDTPATLKRWAQADERIRVLHNEQNKGFIGSCNAGAEAAQCEMLVFLNNDTLPQPGWLPPLLRVLRERPDAGAVGGKLIYPDGTLQEAGGIIFADGSGCNFGRNDKSSNAPLYNFLREVDYCSGALLATPRALFLSFGGFDTRFAPAYYEDTDYCFSLRESGRKVYYQPESVIVHFEGVSSGTDVKSGVKSFQVVNRVKFIEKWQHVLKRHPAAPGRYDFNTLHALSVREEKRDAEAD